jgi:hypothetical protein
LVFLRGKRTDRVDTLFLLPLRPFFFFLVFHMGAFRRFDSCPHDDAALIKYSTSTSTTHITRPPSPPSSPPNSLQVLVDQYQHQPDLLKMILYSKVEEDRRKTEEARLRVKQLDYYMSIHPTKPSPPRQVPRTPPPPSKPTRRSMQPVTKIIETKDPDYQDAYLWKNNGNTTQRKTGWKSTYYKCANKVRGCRAFSECQVTNFFFFFFFLTCS